jgi:hypothetical protein
MNIQFYIKYYRGDVFLVWCRELWKGGTASGDYLVKLLGGPYFPLYDCGMTDNVRAAQKFLECARTVGWIIRDRLRPSVEQQFFGLGGARYGEGEGKYLVDYMWKPNLESKSFQRFVETGTVGKLRPLSKRFIINLESPNSD